MSSATTTRLPRPWVLAALLTAMFLLVVLFASAGSAAAKSGYLGNFNGLYGTAGTPLDSCSLCHTSVPSLNSYGSDWTTNGKNFGAIEGRDSDGDGFSNIQEIQARTMPGDAGSQPAPPTTTQPPTTTTQPPTTTTQPPGATTTTAPPSTTTTTLPPGGSGPLSFSFKEFKVPGSVDVTAGSVSREITVKVEVNNAPGGSNLAADVQLWANGQLAQTIRRTREVEDDGEVELEVKFDFTFNTSHVPRIDWWAIVVANGQASSPATASTTVNGPAPPTTTTQPPPPTTTQPPGTTTTQPPTTSTSQPPTGGPNGAAIYAASCAGCHGADGSGGFGGPVAGTSMNLAQVIAVTANGDGGMPGFSGQLSGPEIDAVAAFVLTLGGSGTPPTTTSTTLPPGTPPGSGAALYRQHCAGCHGANADGGPGGPLVGTSLSFAQQVAVTGHGRGAMPGFSSLLSSAEIESIVRYVAGLGGPGATTTTTVAPDEESGASIYTRLCAGCHGADGSGGLGGPILGTAYHGGSLTAVVTDGVGTMPGFGGQLNDGQVARLVAYVERLAGGSVPADELITATDGSQGVALDSAGGFVHQSQLDGTAGDSPVALGGGQPDASSPLPVGNPLGWTLALAIAAILIALGSAFTGAMPTEGEERTAG